MPVSNIDGLMLMMMMIMMVAVARSKEGKKIEFQLNYG
jgi:hypothetical protein